MLALAWLGVGVHRFDPQREFGVLDGPLLLGSAHRVTGGFVLAPPGLLRLTCYSRDGVELPLPQAEEAMLRAPDGRRFGLRGWVTLRALPENWEALHRAAHGGGLRGVLLDAVRAAAADLVTTADRGPLIATQSRRLQERLGAELKARGAELRRLEARELDFLEVAGDRSVPSPAATHLLIVGWDGADWEVIDPLLAQGKLPHLAGLIERGVRAKLLSISPMLSPVVWTTIATGVEPSRHGILDFLVADANGGARQPVTSAQRRVPTIWELLSRSGVEVGVVGWWASWPADPVRGYLVSDRVAYQLFGYRSDPANAQGKTWPPGLYAELRPLLAAPDSVAWNDIVPYLEGPRRRFADYDAEEQRMLNDFRTLLASGRTYLAIGEMLRRRERPQLEAIYFEGTDTVGHLFMPYRRPQLPGVDPRRCESFAAIVDRYYETADAALGQLLDGRGEDWTVMLLSDHGFASDATRPRTTDSRIGHGAAADWHRRFGVLVLSGANVRRGSRLDEATVYDIAPTVMALFGQPVPRSWPGSVLGAAIELQFLGNHPVRYRSDDPVRDDLRAELGANQLDPAAADLVQKLQTLGYVSADGGAGGGDSSLSARNNAGVAFLAEGRYADAEREFRAGLQSNPGAPMLQVNLGLALRFQGKLEEAGELFERGLEFPATLRLAGLQLAQLRLDAGRAEEAEQLARRVLEKEPDASEVRNVLGLALEAEGHMAEASEAYRTAAELDPNAAMARNNLGNLAKRQGRSEEAESWYLRAIEADPYFMGAYNNLALVYQERGDMKQAIDLYGRALSKSPDNAVVLNNLASLYYATGDHDEARKLWARSAQADPRYASPLSNLASLEINAARYDEAERLLRHALELDPNYGDARLNLALIERTRGDVPAARAELRRATQDPRSERTSWAQLGFFELELGRAEDALSALEHAQRVTPRHVPVLNALGETYRRLGRKSDAVVVWKRSLELAPDQAELRQLLQKLETGG